MQRQSQTVIAVVAISALWLGCGGCQGILGSLWALFYTPLVFCVINPVSAPEDCLALCHIVILAQKSLGTTSGTIAGSRLTELLRKEAASVETVESVCGKNPVLDAESCYTRNRYPCTSGIALRLDSNTMMTQHDAFCIGAFPYIFVKRMKREVSFGLPHADPRCGKYRVA